MWTQCLVLYALEDVVSYTKWIKQWNTSESYKFCHITEKKGTEMKYAH